MKVTFIGGPIDGSIMETDYLSDCIVIVNPQPLLLMHENETTGPLPATTRYRSREIKKGHERMWIYVAEGTSPDYVLRRAKRL